jgi:hypothetical protein
MRSFGYAVVPKTEVDKEGKSDKNAEKYLLHEH